MTSYPFPSQVFSWYVFSVPLAGADGELIEIIQGIVSIPTSKDKPGVDRQQITADRPRSADGVMAEKSRILDGG